MMIFGGAYSAGYAPDYGGMDAVTSYVYAAHAASWDPHVQNGPIEAGGATWRGRPIRLAEGLGNVAGAPAEVPYAWLFRHGRVAAGGDFGAAVLRDPDGDGKPTWAEYVAGSDPADAASVFHVWLDENLDVVWWPDLGDDRRYTVEGKASLSDPEWGEADGGSRFFRVKVELK